MLQAFRFSIFRQVKLFRIIDFPVKTEESVECPGLDFFSDFVICLITIKGHKMWYVHIWTFISLLTS